MEEKEYMFDELRCGTNPDTMADEMCTAVQTAADGTCTVKRKGKTRKHNRHNEQTLSFTIQLTSGVCCNGQSLFWHATTCNTNTREACWWCVQVSQLATCRLAMHVRYPRWPGQTPDPTRLGSSEWRGPHNYRCISGWPPHLHGVFGDLP